MAKTCPKCGRPNPAGAKGLGCLGTLGVLFSLFIAIVVIAGIISPKKKASRDGDDPPTSHHQIKSTEHVSDGTGGKPPECSYLNEEGLPTGPWTLHSDGGLCLSSTLDAGGSNAITFNASGTRNAVNHLQLFEVVSDTKQVRQAYKILGNCAGTLLGKLSTARAKRFRTSAPDHKDMIPLAKAIDSGDTIDGVFFGMPVSLKHGKLPAGKRGWTVTLDVTIPD